MRVDTDAPFEGPSVELVQYLDQRDRDTFEILQRSFFPSQGQYVQIMTVEVGIAGIVLPLLKERGTAAPLVAASVIRNVGIWMVVSLVAGVVILVAGRWIHLAQLNVVAQGILARHKRFAQARVEEDIAEAVRSADEQTAAGIAGFWWVVPASAVADLVFYGALIGGLVMLGRGFAG